MQKPKKDKKKGAKEVNLELKLRFPIPRLPAWLGAGNRLSADATVYPRLDLDMPTVIFQDAVVAGNVAAVHALDPSTQIANWVSRFSNTFREYAVVGARFEISLVAATNASGLVVGFIDETLATAPNAGSLFTPHVEIPLCASPVPGEYVTVAYKPKGYNDLNWTPTVSPVAFAWLKLYASPTQTLTGATTTANLVTRGTLAVAFRGYSNF